jgi:hypothetical protein
MSTYTYRAPYSGGITECSCCETIKHRTPPQADGAESTDAEDDTFLHFYEVNYISLCLPVQATLLQII